MTAFLDGFLLSLSLCLDLGIVNVGILRVATQRGGTPAFLVGLGSGAGDLTYALLSVTGVTLLLQLPGVRWVMWLGGSAVLLWMAARMIREVLHPHRLAVDEPVPADQHGIVAWGADGGCGGRGSPPALRRRRRRKSGHGGAEPPRSTQAAAAMSPARDFAWGWALALASPSAILWFAAVGAGVIATHGGDRAILLPFLLGFWVAGALWSAGLAYGAGALRRVLGPKLVQGMALASAALFVFFAGKVFLDGWHHVR